MDHKQKMRYPFLKNRTFAAHTSVAALLVLVAMGSAVAADAPTAPSVTALNCGHLIDTAAGKVLGETTVVIEAGRVRDVLSGSQAPAGARSVCFKTHIW